MHFYQQKIISNEKNIGKVLEKKNGYKKGGELRVNLTQNPLFFLFSLIT